MALQITDTRMTSDTTEHTAHVVIDALPEIGWEVSWLPYRVFTRDQAVTAMTIAETIAGHPVMTGVQELALDRWAAELGLTGPIAVEEVTKPRPRANRAGDPCPSWCTQDHNKELIPGNPQHGYIDTHHSDMTHAKGSAVQVQIFQRNSGPAISLMHVTGTAYLDLSAKDARSLAVMLAEQFPGLADDLLNATQVIADFIKNGA
jgi:hypothetical protein